MTSTTPRVFEVGGAVRDDLLGLHTKDVDFAVAGLQRFEDLAPFVESLGHTVKHQRPLTLTVVAAVAKDHPLRERTKAADFVMCRRESSASDGRTPDVIEPGTILDDLGRRDLTVNAIARDVDTGEVIDPHGGVEDIATRTLRFVGDPVTRCTEDTTRIMRALRFMVTKDLQPDDEARAFLSGSVAADLLAIDERADGKRTIDMVAVELQRMARFDSARTVLTLAQFPHLMPSIFRDGLHLDGSLKARGG